MQWLLIHSVITSSLAILLAMVFYSIANKSPKLRYAKTLYYTYLVTSVVFATLAVRGSGYRFDPVLVTAILCAASVFAFVLLYIAVSQWQAMDVRDGSVVRYGIAASAAIAALLYLPGDYAASGLYLSKAVVFVLACEVVYVMLFRASDKHYGHYFTGLFLLMVPASIVMSVYYAWQTPAESLSLAFVASESFQNSNLAIMTYAVFPVVISGTGIFFLMTMMMETVDDAKRMAIKDHLTGLYNRRGFADMAKRSLEEARRYEIPVSLVMLDIDDFKKVNDTFGHDAGDEALEFVAETLKENTRATDVLARYGGEEFLVLLTHASQSVAQITAERIRRIIENSLVNYQGKVFQYTASFGVVEIDIGEKRLENAISRVDRALYEAKNNGKNRVCVYAGPPADNVVPIDAA